MTNSNEQIRRNKQYRHDTSHPQNTLTSKLLPDIDCRDRKADVREHKSPPIKMKTHLFMRNDTSQESDAEEPQTQRPDEHGRHRSHDPQNLLCRSIETEVIVMSRKVVRHAYQRETGEARGTNGDEHGRTCIWVRESELDHSSDVACVHEDRDQHTETLSCKTGDYHWHCLVGRLEFGTSGGYGA